MKIDRLLAIMIHLLNHDHATAKSLAARFGVSVRTIQRDMVTLSAAGVPVWANTGANGGYTILESFKIRNHALSLTDIQMVRKALESLRTSYQNPVLSTLIEKYCAMHPRCDDGGVFWDFSIAGENTGVQSLVHTLERAITERRMVRFGYRLVDGSHMGKLAQPLAVHYQWRSWYVLIWDAADKQYKTCKVPRIDDLQVTESVSHREHGDVRALMDDSLRAYKESFLLIEVKFQAAMLSPLREYFPDCTIQQTEDGDMLMTIEVPASERLWQGLLLSFGDAITIVNPPGYRDRLVSMARSFAANYDI